MKKLYFLDEHEKRRILNLHESATKKQYIPEASFGSSGWVSVSYTNFSLTLNNYLEMERRGSGSELKLFKGTVFSKENATTIVTRPNTTYQLVGDYTGGVEEEGKGKIRYYCKTKEFAIEGRNAKFWGEDFQDDVQKAFDALCDELPNASQNGGQGEVEKNAISCGWKKQDGTADVEGYKNAKWQCPKPVTTTTTTRRPGTTTTVVKPVIPSDTDLDAVYAKL